MINNYMRSHWKNSPRTTENFKKKPIENTTRMRYNHVRGEKMNDNFKAVLRQRHITAYRLAKDTGIPYTTIYELTTGKKDINKKPLEDIIRIAAALQTSLDNIQNPVHVMDKRSGKYRNVKYTWSYDGIMLLNVKYKEESKTIKTDLQMTNIDDVQVYIAVTELIIDNYLNEVTEEKEIQRLQEKLKCMNITS